MSYMPDYVLVRSFENVDLINEVGIESSLQYTNLDKQYGISNMNESKQGFEQILKDVDENQILENLNIDLVDKPLGQGDPLIIKLIQVLSILT